MLAKVAFALHICCSCPLFLPVYTFFIFFTQSDEDLHKCWCIIKFFFFFYMSFYLIVKEEELVLPQSATRGRWLCFGTFSGIYHSVAVCFIVSCCLLKELIQFK